jgi:5'-nucleotidase
MPHILLTNDDGVFAPGILALAKALQAQARLTIVAPNKECSASSNALTTRSPLRLKQVELDGGIPGWTCDGTPVDCVKMGLRIVCEQDPPDLVISGINSDSNLGSDVLYSGTVGAAMDGVLLGVPAFAISLSYGEPRDDFSNAARFAGVLAGQVLEQGLPEGVLLNVNVPPGNGVRDVRITAQGRGRFLESYDSREDPAGRPYYWIQGLREPAPEHPDSDEAAVADRAISVTPLRVDMTDRDCMAALQSWKLDK